MARYVKKNDLYLCLDQNPWSLALRLLTRAQTLELSRPSDKPFLSWVPGRVFRPLRILKLVRSAFKQGAGSDHNDLVALHVKGDFALQRSTGFKIFNLQKKTVTTLFDHANDFSRDGTTELKDLQKLGGWGVAPALIKDESVPHDMGYTEQYINVRKSEPTHINTRIFFNGVLPLVIALAKKGGTNIVPFEIYLDRLFNLALDLLGKQDDSRAGRELTAFLQDIYTHVQNNCPHVLRTVHSHGDLTEKNLFITPNGPVAIDWGTHDERTLLYDVYSHFLSLIARFGDQEKVEPQRIFSLLDSAKEMVYEQAVRGQPDLIDEVAQQRAYPMAYRKVFYLELIATRLRHFVEPVRVSRPGICKHRLAQLQVYTQVFKMHEKFTPEHER